MHNIVLRDYWVQCAGGQTVWVEVVQMVRELLDQVVIGERMEQVVICRMA